MSEIYRKSSLEKLSSPEQLDKAIVIISPNFYIAVIAAAVVVAVALVWAIFGRLPQNVSANGIFMNRGGIHTVYSEVGGTVTEILVDTGHQVKKGDVIAKLSSRNAEQKIAALNDRKKAVEAVTLTSVSDKATADNKVLLDLKSQGLTMDSALIADQYLLEARQEELKAQKAKTAAARAGLEQLEIQYFLTLLPVDTNKANITFEENETNLDSAKGYLETAKRDLLELDAQNENTEERYDKAKDRYKHADEIDADYEELEAEYQEAKRDWEDYRDAAEEYRRNIAAWENVINQEGARYEAAKSGYIDQVVLEESSEAYKNQVSTAYERALSDYNTEAGTERELEDAILQLEAQIAGGQSDMLKQNSALAAQFDAAKNAVLSQLDREIEELNEEIGRLSITSTLDGTVTELSVVEGQVINAGDYVARVSQGDSSDKLVVCYVPVADGRKIKTGMTASIYPSTVSKQEYGHMRGTVEYVDAYVTSRAEITNQVGVTSLVESFMESAPVVEVRLSLEKDDSTKSGYWWSSRRGGEIEITAGTMISSDISINEQAPISMVIPYLKEKLTIKHTTEKKSDE